LIFVENSHENRMLKAADIKPPKTIKSFRGFCLRSHVNSIFKLNRDSLFYTLLLMALR